MKKLLILCIMICWVNVCGASCDECCGQGYNYIQGVVMTVEEFFEVGPKDVVSRIISGEIKLEVIFCKDLTRGSRYVMYDVYCDGSVHDIRMLTSY